MQVKTHRRMSRMRMRSRGDKQTEFSTMYLQQCGGEKVQENERSKDYLAMTSPSSSGGTRNVSAF